MKLQLSVLIAISPLWAIAQTCTVDTTTNVNVLLSTDGTNFTTLTTLDALGVSPGAAVPCPTTATTVQSETVPFADAFGTGTVVADEVQGGQQFDDGNSIFIFFGSGAPTAEVVLAGNNPSPFNIGGNSGGGGSGGSSGGSGEGPTGLIDIVDDQVVQPNLGDSPIDADAPLDFGLPGSDTSASTSTSGYKPRFPNSSDRDLYRAKINRIKDANNYYDEVIKPRYDWLIKRRNELTDDAKLTPENITIFNSYVEKYNESVEYYNFLKSRVREIVNEQNYRDGNPLQDGDLPDDFKFDNTSEGTGGYEIVGSESETGRFNTYDNQPEGGTFEDAEFDFSSDGVPDTYTITTTTTTGRFNNRFTGGDDGLLENLFMTGDIDEGEERFFKESEIIEMLTSDDPNEVQKGVQIMLSIQEMYILDGGSGTLLQEKAELLMKVILQQLGESNLILSTGLANELSQSSF